jgi:hypothetical protein
MREDLQFVLHTSSVSSMQKMYIHFMIDGYNSLIADKEILLNHFTLLLLKYRE